MYTSPGGCGHQVASAVERDRRQVTMIASQVRGEAEKVTKVKT
jgi:hypothetical protein